MRKNNGRRRHRGQNRRNLTLKQEYVIESFGPVSQIRGNVQQLNENTIILVMLQLQMMIKFCQKHIINLPIIIIDC